MQQKVTLNKNRKNTDLSRSWTRVSIRVGNSLLISWITRVSMSTSSISFNWKVGKIKITFTSNYKYINRNRSLIWEPRHKSCIWRKWSCFRDRVKWVLPFYSAPLDSVKRQLGKTESRAAWSYAKEASFPMSSVV